MNIENDKQRKRHLARTKKAALSAIFGTIITLGVTAAAGSGLYFIFQEQADPFLSNSGITVTTLSALLDGDTLSITGAIKNIGQITVSEIYIDSISVSDLRIIQDADTGILTLTDGTASSNRCAATFTGCTAALGIGTFKGFSVGDAVGTVTESVLEGGRTNAFKIEVTETTSPDISKVVNISDRLTLKLQFESGEDTLISDAYTVRVRPG